MPLHNKNGKQVTKRYHRKQMAIQYADASNEQVYGRIEKALGNCSFYVNTIAGEQKVASLSGVMKKQGRVKPNDLVLIEPMSESTDRKYQIIFRYTDSQVRILEKEGHLKTVTENKEEEIESEEEEDGFEFEGESEAKNEVNLEVDQNFVDNI